MAMGVFPSGNCYISSAYENLLVATFVAQGSPLQLNSLELGNANQTWTISDTTETSGIITLKGNTGIEPNPIANGTVAAGNNTITWAFKDNGEGIYTICDLNGTNCWGVDNSEQAPGQEILYDPIPGNSGLQYFWLFLAA